MKKKIISYIERNGTKEQKKFEYGDYPLSVNCELVSTCNLACTMCYTITDKFQNSVGSTKGHALDTGKKYN